jgi:hypothetical protein
MRSSLRPCPLERGSRNYFFMGSKTHVALVGPMGEVKLPGAYKGTRRRMPGIVVIKCCGVRFFGAPRKAEKGYL